MDTFDIRYVRTVDDVNIAYQVRGEGPVDLVYIMGLAGNFEIEFEPSWGARFLERLSSFSRRSSSHRPSRVSSPAPASRSKTPASTS